MGFTDLFWIAFLLLALTPMIQQRIVEMNRLRLMKQIEAKCKCRVISLIHRQEALSFLGVAFSRYIDIEDSEAILRAIRFTPNNMPISLILHTPGGLVLAAEQIAHALQKHKAPVTVFVPHYAMSGGTLLALAADQIIMDENAVLGPVDPQLGEYPAASLIEVTKIKDLNRLEDRTLIFADIARKAQAQVKDLVKGIISDKLPADKAEVVAEALTSGRWTHDYPIGFSDLKALGLPVKEGLPEEVYKLMDLYPQTGRRRPSVQYIPVPYRREDHRRGRNDRR